MIPLLAGFDGTRIPWSGREMLDETRHTPDTDMAAHYAAVRPMGATGARDCLSWRHDIKARVEIASGAGLDRVIYDMAHFDLPPDPEGHAVACERALGAGAWAIAVNEPTMHGAFLGEGSIRFVEAAERMMRAAPNLRYACCDPLHELRRETWWATDRLVESGLVELVGINYYPHCGQATLREVLGEARRRYPGIPLAITETGWHVGHPRLAPGERRMEWLQTVRRVCEDAGGVEFICWMPWLDTPSWNCASEGVWACGWPAHQMEPA